MFLYDYHNYTFFLHFWTIKTPILYIGIRHSRIPEYNKGYLSVTKATVTFTPLKISIRTECAFEICKWVAL